MHLTTGLCICLRHIPSWLPGGATLLLTLVLLPPITLAGMLGYPAASQQPFHLRVEVAGDSFKEEVTGPGDAEANSADRPTIKAAITALSADIAAYNANPDVTGTAVERLAKLEARVKELERQVRRANVILRHYTRGLL